MSELPSILSRVEALGYRTFKSGDYNLNIIGVRSRARVANSFDDTMYVVYKEDGVWVQHEYSITTDPGLYWLENPSRVAGTAILKSGQYRSAFSIGKHRGRYTALVQSGPVDVYRDSNRDSHIDMEETSIQTGFFGINIHRSSSSGSSPAVNKWSAGCQVFQNTAEYDSFIALCRKSSRLYGDKFTYTLLEDQ